MSSLENSIPSIVVRIVSSTSVRIIRKPLCVSVRSISEIIRVKIFPPVRIIFRSSGIFACESSRNRDHITIWSVGSCSKAWINRERFVIASCPSASNVTQYFQLYFTRFRRTYSNPVSSAAPYHRLIQWRRKCLKSGNFSRITASVPSDEPSSTRIISR